MCVLIAHTHSRYRWRERAPTHTHTYLYTHSPYPCWNDVLGNLFIDNLAFWLENVQNVCHLPCTLDYRSQISLIIRYIRSDIWCSCAYLRFQFSQYSVLLIPPSHLWLSTLFWIDIAAQTCRLHFKVHHTHKYRVALQFRSENVIHSIEWCVCECSSRIRPWPITDYLGRIWI